VHCLKGLQLQQADPPFEVIVVDSGSDPAVRAVAGQFRGVQLLRSEDKLSSGAARNLGAARARANVLAFLDADCIPGPEWSKAALDAIQAGAMLAGGPILDVLPWHLIAATDNRLQFVDFPSRRPAGPHPYLPGTHMAMPLAVFNGSGGFDTSATPAQDLLLSRPIAATWPGLVRFAPRMIVRHWGRRQWAGFLQHQYAFGYSRAEHRLMMDSSLTWLGHHPVFAWVVILRRLLYLSLRVVQWNLPDLPRYLLEMPVLVVGLIAWTRGFYAGMKTGIRSG
jgi:glycosyltransferase involved in cell wall biosynthesis